MAADRRILVTGSAGSIGFPLARALAGSNEVWGVARFSQPGSQRALEEVGVITRSVDIASGDFGDLPEDFDYVLHLAAYMHGSDYDQAVRVNAEGTALLMRHCRSAKGILVMSTTGVYLPNPDPWHPYREGDTVGDARVPGMPIYSLSKIVQEGVARSCARLFNVPTVIARMNAAYGATGQRSLLRRHLDQILAGEEIRLRWDPNPYSPIDNRDICAQALPLLESATTHCPVINWGGDEAVAAQSWCAYMGELLGTTPRISIRGEPGSQRGVVLDVTKRQSITGPCSIDWKQGVRDLVAEHGGDQAAAGA